jgi:hypothetical protein
MRRECAWCGLAMGVKEPLDDERITHGICCLCSEVLTEILGSCGSQPGSLAPTLQGPHGSMRLNRGALNAVNPAVGEREEGRLFSGSAGTFPDICSPDVLSLPADPGA